MYSDSLKAQSILFVRLAVLYDEESKIFNKIITYYSELTMRRGEWESKLDTPTGLPNAISSVPRERLSYLLADRMFGKIPEDSAKKARKFSNFFLNEMTLPLYIEPSYFDKSIALILLITSKPFNILSWSKMLNSPNKTTGTECCGLGLVSQLPNSWL